MVGSGGAAVVGERVALWQTTRIRLNKRMRVIKWVVSWFSSLQL
jgi:hypothetical protein